MSAATRLAAAAAIAPGAGATALVPAEVIGVAAPFATDTAGAVEVVAVLTTIATMMAAGAATGVTCAVPSGDEPVSPVSSLFRAVLPFAASDGFWTPAARADVTTVATVVPFGVAGAELAGAVVAGCGCVAGAAAPPLSFAAVWFPFG
jgi:hypothetical protein